MRSIKNNLLQRLVVQAEEAELQGLTKIATALTDQIAKTAVRDNETFYLYGAQEFETDVENNFWNVVIRAADFYNTQFDAMEMQHLIEKSSQDLLQEIRVKLGTTHGVGAHESNVPGEIFSKVVLEVE